ncbi:hypothetical protein [uncultured Pedobacter sp.]|uniref:hypothetical protein n=1 Tax=uncultured Pedobacter sp. TaxID=246139 RepID=UPI0025E9D0EC|nr:hypothetical protein [uncultured Pedobacter sp.]
MRKYAIIMLLGIISCTAKSPSGQYFDKDIKVMAQLKKNTSNNRMQTFMVRVFPDQKIMEQGKEKIAESFLYHADSCFYLLKNNAKLYPEYVEPIVNGIKGSYEFLVGFNNQNLSSKEYILIYQDQMINKKKYVLTIK